jgi:hypothetical protein
MPKTTNDIFWVSIGAILAMPGIEIQGISLSYIPCFFAIMTIPKLSNHFPASVKLLFALGFLSLVSEFLFPTSDNYLVGRYRSITNQINTKFASTTEAENFILWLKFSVALMGGVAIISYAYKKNKQALLVQGFILGSLTSVLNCVLTLKPGEGAYLQSYGLGRTTTTFGMICSYSICLVFSQKIKLSNRVKFLSVLFLMLGVFASGSRGAALTAVVSLYFVLIWRKGASRLIWLIWTFNVFIVFLYYVGSDLLEKIGVRALTSNSSTINSSLIRSKLREQALQDWKFDPFGGVGFSVLTQGHSTYLQTLAAAGLFFFLSYLAIDLRSIQISLNIKKTNLPGFIPGIVFCSIFNHFTQNQIDVPFLYMILGLVLTEPNQVEKLRDRNYAANNKI